MTSAASRSAVPVERVNAKDEALHAAAWLQQRHAVGDAWRDCVVAAPGKMHAIRHTKPLYERIQLRILRVDTCADQKIMHVGMSAA